MITIESSAVAWITYMLSVTASISIIDAVLIIMLYRKISRLQNRLKAHSVRIKTLENSVSYHSRQLNNPITNAHPGYRFVSADDPIDREQDVELTTEIMTFGEETEE